MSVTIDKALDYIYANTKTKNSKIIPIEESLGFVLAQDVIATHNLPPFDNSAMDGYAIKIRDAEKELKISHTIFAGDSLDIELREGECIKIMTGAIVPKGCDTVVPIENVILLDNNTIKIEKKPKDGANIRKCAEDIKKESILLKRGQRIFAHHITLFASQGISHIKVFKRPRVAIFASGNELKMHFESVEAHQLYNTNSLTFFSRAKELGCEVEFIGTAKDTLEDIKEHIANALDSDLIITSGGVSVGDADFTKEAFSSFGYEIFFDQVEIKPGKPTVFGRIKDTFILNLPGNPLAATLNFELFTKSILLALSGDEDKYIGVIETKMKEEYIQKSKKNIIAPGYFDGTSFLLYKNISAGTIKPMSEANAYILIGEDCQKIAKDDIVKIIPTRFSFNSKNKINLIN